MSDIGLPKGVEIPCNLDLDPANPCSLASYFEQGVGPVCAVCFLFCVRARGALAHAGMSLQPFEEGQDA